MDKTNLAGQLSWLAHYLGEEDLEYLIRIARRAVKSRGGIQARREDPTMKESIRAREMFFSVPQHRRKEMFACMKAIANGGQTVQKQKGRNDTGKMGN